MMSSVFAVGLVPRIVITIHFDCFLPCVTVSMAHMVSALPVGLARVSVGSNPIPGSIFFNYW